MATPEIQLTADVRLQNQTTFERQIRDLERKALAGMRVGGGQPLGRLTSKVTEFDKSLEAANARVVAFGASATIIAGVSIAIKEMVSQTIKVEKALTDINVLLNLSNSSLTKFGDDLFSIAKATGQSFDEVSKAATEFSRQGLSVEDTLKRTNAALVLTRLSGMDAAKAVETLTATLNSFNKEALNQNEIVNRLAAVDARFAVSTGDLAEGLARSGAAAQDAGVSLNELIALITSAQQRTARGGAVIGNALKSILTRTSRGGTLDELEKVGVAVRDLSGNTLPAVQILESLAKTYDTLGDAQKSFVGELVGGVYQINQLKAYIGDLSKENSIYAQALRAAGSAQDEAFERNEALNKTLAATVNEAEQNFTRLAAIVGSSVFGPSLKTVLGQFNEASDLIDGEGVGEKIGSSLLKGIGNALSGPGLIFGTLIGAKLFTQFARFTAEALAGISGVGRATERVQDVQRGVNLLMSQQPELQNIILSKTTSIAEKEQALLAVIRQQIAAKRELATVTESVAVTALNAGVRFNPRSDSFKIKPKAMGHVPMSHIPPEAVMSEVAGARQAGYSITPDNVRAMNAVIDGERTTIVYNNKERVIHNYNGTGEPAIIPPNKTVEDLIQNRSNGFAPIGNARVNVGNFDLKRFPKAFSSIVSSSDFLRNNIGLKKKDIAPITFKGRSDESDGAYYPRSNRIEIFEQSMLENLAISRHGSVTQALKTDKAGIAKTFEARLAKIISHEAFHNAFTKAPDVSKRRFQTLADKSFTIPKSDDEAFEYIAKQYYNGDVAKARKEYGHFSPIEEALAIQFPRLLGFAGGRAPKIKLGGRAEFNKDGSNVGYAEFKKNKDTLTLDTVATYKDAQGNRPQGTGVLDFAFRELINRGREGGLNYIGFTPMNSRVVKKAQGLFGDKDAFGNPITFGKASKIKIGDFNGLFSAAGSVPTRVNIPRPFLGSSKQIIKKPKTALDKAKEAAYAAANAVLLNTPKVLNNPATGMFGDDIMNGVGKMFGFARGYINAASGDPRWTGGLSDDERREAERANKKGTDISGGTRMPRSSAGNERAALDNWFRQKNREIAQGSSNGPHLGSVPGQSLTQADITARNAAARALQDRQAGGVVRMMARRASRHSQPVDILAERQRAVQNTTTLGGRLNAVRASILSVPNNEARHVQSIRQKDIARGAAIAQENAELDAKKASRAARRSLGSTDKLANRQSAINERLYGTSSAPVFADPTARLHDSVLTAKARTTALKEQLLANRAGTFNPRTGLKFGDASATPLPRSETASPTVPKTTMRERFANGRRSSTELLRNSLQYKDQAFAQKMSGVGMTASFVAPMAGAAIGSFFEDSSNPNSAGNRISRGATEATSSIGTGLAFAAIGGPAGAAVGGVVAAFGTLKAVVNNLTPSLEDFEQSLAKRQEERGERTSALQGFAAASSQVEELTASGASQAQIKEALSRRSSAFTNLTPEQRNSLRGDFSTKNVDKVMRDAADTEAKEVLKDRSLQSISRSSEANKNSFGIKQSNIDAAFGLAGESGTNALAFLRDAATNSESSYAANALAGWVMGQGDRSTDGEVSKKLIAGIDVSKADSGEISAALKDVARIANTNPQDAREQLASIAGRAGIDEDAVKELLTQRGGSEATTIVGDAIIQLQNTIRDFKPILEEQEKQARKVETNDVRRARESVAAGSVRSIENNGFFRGIRNEFTSSFQGNIANARATLENQAFDGSAQYLTGFSKQNGDNKRQMDAINTNLDVTTTNIENRRLDDLDSLASRSIGAAMSVDSVKNSLLGDSSDASRAIFTRISNSFAKGDVSEEGLTDLRKAVGAELNNASLSDEVKNKLAAAASEIDGIILEYKKTNDAAAQQTTNAKTLAEQTRVIARETQKLQAEIVKQRHLASLFDFEKSIGNARETTSISAVSKAQARGLELNRSARTGTDMRRFTKEGRQQIRQDRESIAIDAAGGILNQFEEGFMPKQDQIRAMLQNDGTLKNEAQFNDDAALQSQFKNYQEYSSSVIDNSDMGKQLKSQRGALARGFAASGLRDVRSATSQYAGDFLNNFSQYGKFSSGAITPDFQNQFNTARQSGNIPQLQQLASQLSNISNSDGQGLIQQFIAQLGTQSQYERNVTKQAEFKAIEKTGGIEADALTNTTFNAQMEKLLAKFDGLIPSAVSTPRVEAPVTVTIQAQGLSATQVAAEFTKLTSEHFGKLTRDLESVTEWAKENGHKPTPQPQK